MLKYFNIQANKSACWINPGDFGAHRQSLIFIHGSGSNSNAWSLQYGKLHKSYNIAAVNLPGHGGSAGEGKTSVDEYCVRVKGVLDVLNLPNPILVGHSLGAAIALLLAVKYPEAASGVVAAGGGLKMPINPLLLEGLKTNYGETINLICKFSLAKSNREKFFTSIHKSLAAANVDVLQGDLLACSKINLTGQVEKIHLPVMVVCGTEDKMTPPDFSRQIALAVEGAELALIEGAGHMVMMEKSQEFNDLLNKFAVSLLPGVALKV